MKLNKRIASQDEQERIAGNIAFCQRYSIAARGLPYDNEIVNSAGCSVELYVSEHTYTPTIQLALREIYNKLDVVRHSVVVVPDAWLNAGKKRKLVCPTCGHDTIGRDAMATWDTDKQDWVLANVWDTEMWCDKCAAKFNEADEVWV